MAIDGMLADSVRRTMMEGRWRDHRKRQILTSYHVNILCLIGIFIGTFALLFLPWLEIRYSLVFIENIGYKEWTAPIDFTEIIWYNYYYGLFVIGLVVSIITPIGGIIELIGLLIFMFDDIVLTRGISPQLTSYPVLGIGFWLAFLSASIIIVSILWSIGFNEYPRRYRLMRVLLTFSPKPGTEPV